MLETRAKYLVVDTSAFLECVSLQNFGENVITIPDVIDEIRNKRQYRHLLTLIHDVQIKNVFDESISYATEFAKKTGDYAILSATDIKLIALTYQLESQFVGADHLRKDPVVKHLNANINVKSPNSKPNLDTVNGLCLPVNIDKHLERSHKTRKVSSSSNLVVDELSDSSESESISSNDENLVEALESLEIENGNIDTEEDEYETADESITSDCEEESDNETQSDEECSDEDGWITSENITQLKRALNGNLVEEMPVVVGCLTTDFAIQNVLMQMGLNVISVDGKVIKEMRTYILRCYACFKTTSDMRKVFCPNCGNKTLKRVSVYLDKEGNTRLFINFKKPISTKGKRFSLPLPQGGKHAVNPKLCEDARRPHQRPSKLARTKTNALHEDYVAEFSPFATRDVHSRSAQLGFNKGKPVFKYWMRRNPNESRRLPKK